MSSRTSAAVSLEFLSFSVGCLVAAVWLVVLVLATSFCCSAIVAGPVVVVDLGGDGDVILGQCVPRRFVESSKAAFTIGLSVYGLSLKSGCSSDVEIRRFARSEYTAVERGRIIHVLCSQSRLYLVM